MNFLTQKRKNILLQKTEPKTSIKSQFNKFYYKQLTRLTGIGGWYVDFVNKKSYFDPQARELLDVPKSYLPSLKNSLDFYPKDFKAQAFNMFQKCSAGEEFTVVLKMQAFNGRQFWVRATGAPIFNDEGNQVGIQGVFQDIDAEKEKELSLQKSLRVIESQNTRILNFSKLISHSLRSHSSNLGLSLDLLKEANKEDEADLKQNLFAISNELEKTLSHLDEITHSQNKSLLEKKEVRFAEILQKVMNNLHLTLQENEAEVYYEFSDLPHIDYIPSYLESIFQNLISNALKYKHPERKPVIDIFTTQENGKNILTIKDNGLGIDLEKYGHRLFNIYQTFHQHPESVGIGLFIVKNQVQSLEGAIEVKSKVGLGTTFKITL